MRDTQYSNNTPGPPFHLANVNSIDMHNQNNPYLLPQVSAQSGLGSATSQDFTPAGFTFNDGSEMDLSGGDRSNDMPSPATISSNSRGGSTSHSSYSPGQQPEHHLPYRASPKPGFTNLANSNNNNNNNTGIPNAGSTAFPAFSTSSTPGVEMFSNVFSTTGNVADEAFNQGFLMGTDWEYGALSAGTGMTPMSDGSWNTMLESVTMGWDGAVPAPVQQDPSSRHGSG